MASGYLSPASVLMANVVIVFMRVEIIFLVAVEVILVLLSMLFVVLRSILFYVMQRRSHMWQLWVSDMRGNMRSSKV